MPKKPYTVTIEMLKNWLRNNTHFMVAGLMTASLSIPVSAAPFATTYSGQIDASNIPEIIANQSYTVTFVFDNGASSSASQSWTSANLKCTIWRFNDARNAVFMQNLVDTPPTIASGSVITDATGALTSMFGEVVANNVEGGKFTTSGLNLSGLNWFANSANGVLYNLDYNQFVNDRADGVQMNPSYWTAPQPFEGTCDDSPMITSSALPTAVVNQPYTTTLEATGGEKPLKWSASGLPVGLSIDPASGVISGTPTSPQTATVTVVVTDNASRQQTTTLTLVVDPLDITFVGAGPNITLAGGVVAAAYSQPLQVTGGLPPYTFSVVGDLPPGLELDTASGVVSGTPTTPGTYSFSVMAMDSAVQPELAAKAVHVAEQTFTIVITAAPVVQATPTPVPALGGLGLLLLSGVVAGSMGLMRRRKSN
ncbi:putative Ig domain-containing protein [Comamonas piscis]|uniref:Putative Ig domain-containing protein n=1 Tax=Comamonas piscis TaxID=1562974 RepID=A0A7G5EG60_9BURK|nr:Ig domain-containing protein [Comamonas piscis]QMV72985.1 putative Ig domain-containing protein [Comamonas piscis]WSO35768.1 Ig domain-containing protein [Comamonas piscis]